MVTNSKGSGYMRIVIEQQIMLKDISSSFRPVYKFFDSNVVPHVGDKIGDGAYKDPYEYEVVEVILDYNEDKAYVTLHVIELESEDRNLVAEWVNMFKLHGWTDSLLPA
jgi:hypothetical protein